MERQLLLNERSTHSSLLHLYLKSGCIASTLVMWECMNRESERRDTTWKCRRSSEWCDGKLLHWRRRKQSFEDCKRSNWERECRERRCWDRHSISMEMCTPNKGAESRKWRYPTFYGEMSEEDERFENCFHLDIFLADQTDQQNQKPERMVSLPFSHSPSSTTLTEWERRSRPWLVPQSPQRFPILQRIKSRPKKIIEAALTIAQV